MKKKYYYVIVNYSIDKGKTIGIGSHYTESNLGFLSVENTRGWKEKELTKDFPNTKDITVIVTNFIEISKEAYLYNVKNL